MTHRDDEVNGGAPGAAADRPRGRGDPVPPAVRRQLWLHLQSRGWRTLAVVPADAGMAAGHAARALAAIAAANGEVFDMFDARNARPDSAAAEVEAAAGGSRRVLVVTLAVEEDPATVPLARAADAVLLCVSIGSTSLRAASGAIAAIGKDRFVGSMSLRAPRIPAPIRAAQAQEAEDRW